MSSLIKAAVFGLVSVIFTTVVAVPTPESPTNAVLISTSSPSTDSPSCLREAYYGSYGGSLSSKEHIYIPSIECLNSPHSLDALSSGSVIPLSSNFAENADRLVWIGQAGVSPSLLSYFGLDGMQQSWQLISSRSALISHQQPLVYDHTEQVLEVPTSPTIQLLHLSDTSLLLQVPSSILPVIDTLLPSHLVPVTLPVRSLPNSWEPVPAHLAENLANITRKLKFSSELDKILSDGLVLDEVRRDVRWLTGEGPSGIESRHSFTPGALKAAHWIKGQVEATGATCTLQHFLEGFSPNVICHYPSLENSTEHVILSAHYDSRGSFGMVRAPGGDDDGSGSGHLLNVAKAIASQRVEFQKKVTLAFFAGEEQGLLGSHHYAELLHGFNNVTVILQIQADMLAYHDSGEPLQIGLPESIGTPEATYLLGNLSQLYSPELVVGTTAACCSDHQSFVAFGIPATQVFERNGWIIDPMYHNSGDLTGRENYDFEQVISIAKVTMAAVLTVAGYRLKSG